MSVTSAENTLITIASEYTDAKKEQLLKAALIYAQAKRKAANSRDRWKEKKRLTNG